MLLLVWSQTTEPATAANTPPTLQICAVESDEIIESVFRGNIECKMRARLHCCVCRSGTFWRPLISRHLRPMWPPSTGSMRSSGEAWILERTLPKYLVSHSSAAVLRNIEGKQLNEKGKQLIEQYDRTCTKDWCCGPGGASPEVSMVKTRSCNNLS